MDRLRSQWRLSLLVAPFETCRRTKNKEKMGVTMNAKFFVALFGASVLMAAPVQAKFIGIAIYDPKVMLPICKNEIAQGRAGS